MYSAKVMDHFANPRNVGEIENADGVGEVGNPKCGDIMKMLFEDRQQRHHRRKIQDVRLRRSHRHFQHRHRDDQRQDHRRGAEADKQGRCGSAGRA